MFTPLNPQRLFNWGVFHWGAIYYQVNAIFPASYLEQSAPEEKRSYRLTPLIRALSQSVTPRALSLDKH